MASNIGILIVEKTGVVKPLCVKTFKEEELYKKCGFKTKENFNKYTDWLPMERCVLNMDLRISEDDRHPNLEGIKAIGDAMANCIEGIHNENIFNQFEGMNNGD